MKYAIDMDGCLAQFNHSFLTVLNDVNGTQKVMEGEPLVWHWPQQQLGFSDEEVGRAWDWVGKHPLFWGQLPSYPDAVKSVMLAADREMRDEFYYLTFRSPVGAKVYTEEWLKNHGAINPTVILCKDKGPVCKALGIDAIVDDYPANIQSVLECSPGTRCYLVNRPYNQEVRHEGIIRVAGVSEFLRLEERRRLSGN